MPSVGVVLGAGGIVGAAYHAGVLAALAEAGFDARDADLIVGTSAGAAVGATLRAGFPAADLAARNLGEPISDTAAAIIGITGDPPALDLRPRPFSRAPLPSSPKLLFRSARHPTKALIGLLPTGTITTDIIGERISLMYGNRTWPDLPLWVCAVDLEHGKRVVFGRDAPDPSIGLAVQASSSIPGFFRPVEHDHRRYVDGGAHSPTNADLVAEALFDVVVIVSPMSATRLAHRSLIPNARPMHCPSTRKRGQPHSAVQAPTCSRSSRRPTSSWPWAATRWIRLAARQRRLRRSSRHANGSVIRESQLDSAFSGKRPRRNSPSFNVNRRLLALAVLAVAIVTFFVAGGYAWVTGDGNVEQILTETGVIGPLVFILVMWCHPAVRGPGIRLHGACRHRVALSARDHARLDRQHGRELHRIFICTMVSSGLGGGSNPETNAQI